MLDRIWPLLLEGDVCLVGHGHALRILAAVFLQQAPRFGDRLTFWGGGVDTQTTLPFGTSAEVREQVLGRCETCAPGGGFVFNSIHNIQAGTPVENIVAMFDAVREYQGRDRRFGGVQARGTA